MKKIILIIFCILQNIFIYSQYNISENGENFIKNFERCSLTSYWDVNGYSIGWGHHSSDITENMKITIEEANEFFKNDIYWVEKAANRLINELPYNYEFSQSFFDGLCSLIYNCGTTGIKQSEFYIRLKKCRVKNGIMNESDYNYTLVAIKTTNCKYNGHFKRRNEEYKMMIN